VWFGGAFSPEGDPRQHRQDAEQNGDGPQASSLGSARSRLREHDR
jgi:hypothetical protein